MSRTVHVSVGARLHFGLLAFGRSQGRQFGGAGVMVKSPRVNLSIVPNDRFEIRGASPDRVREFAAKWSAFHGLDLRCLIEVHGLIPAHAGLGSGTQLALSVAQGLCTFHNLMDQSTDELAQSVNRGGRSAVGSHGFRLGGFIAERGRHPDGGLGELMVRCELPANWRVILVRQPTVAGIHGLAETKAFAGELPAIPGATTKKMTNILTESIVPSAQAGDIQAFGEAVYDYGMMAGGCFQNVQGGVFASQDAESLAAALRRHSVFGVGQSSWGPTLFGFVESEARARDVVSTMMQLPLCRGWQCEIVRIENQGAVVLVNEE